MYPLLVNPDNHSLFAVDLYKSLESGISNINKQKLYVPIQCEIPT